jgi:hypothetical protein
MKHFTLNELTDIAEFIAVETGKLTKQDLFPYCKNGKLLVDDVYNEILRRKFVFRNSYPFEISNSIVKSSANASYRLCLRCSVVNHTSIGIVFEQATPVLLSNFFGFGTRVLSCGTSNIEKPKSFWSTISWIASEMSIPEGSSVRPSRLKDGGLDVIVWKDFSDKRSGFPIMLVQSTVQRNIFAKCKDIDRRMWTSWLSMDVDPIIAIAIPNILMDKNEYQEISVNSMILDRIRLSELETPTTQSEISQLSLLLDVESMKILNGAT